jgi:hypothetical protein
MLKLLRFFFLSINLNQRGDEMKKSFVVLCVMVIVFGTLGMSEAAIVKIEFVNVNGVRHK